MNNDDPTLSPHPRLSKLVDPLHFDDRFVAVIIFIPVNRHVLNSSSRLCCPHHTRSHQIAHDIHRCPLDLFPARRPMQSKASSPTPNQRLSLRPAVSETSLNESPHFWMTCYLISQSRLASHIRCWQCRTKCSDQSLVSCEQQQDCSAQCCSTSRPSRWSCKQQSEFPREFIHRSITRWEREIVSAGREGEDDCVSFRNNWLALTTSLLTTSAVLFRTYWRMSTMPSPASSLVFPSWKSDQWFDEHCSHYGVWLGAHIDKCSWRPIDTTSTHSDTNTQGTQRVPRLSGRSPA